MGPVSDPEDAVTRGSPTLLLEVCAGSAVEARLAASAGADRIELCRDLGRGGLTPSLQETECAVETGIPVVVLVRPRAGDFLYCSSEKRMILRDIRDALRAGASAVSTGALDPSGRIDPGFLADAVDAAGGAPVVFHRAFDLVPDRLEALESVSLAGAARILTSCGAPTALEGADALAGLVARAGGRVEILPAGGIRSWNIVEVMRRTGCRQAHGSFSVADAHGCIGLDPDDVRAARRALDGFSSRGTPAQ